MIIRGRADKNAQSAMANYTNNELPSVVVKQKNSIPAGSLQHVGREVSERSRRKLSINANSVVAGGQN